MNVFLQGLILCIVLALRTVPVLAYKSSACSNHGQTLKGTYTKCDCSLGYKGYDCSKKVGPCEGRPCRNNGVCKQRSDGTFTCKCDKKYEGILCERKILPCDRKPCKNGGKCTNDGDKCFKCECLLGFKGSDCSKKVLPCEVSPCQNGGVCTNVNSGFKCACKDGFAGMACDKKDAIHSSLILFDHPDWIAQLKKWLPAKRGLQMCYRASRHGFAASTFHSLCDNRGPTVSLVRSGYYVFGGFTDQSWGGSSKYIRSTNSFLFSFRNKYNLKPFKAPIYKSQYAILTNPGYGPTFGGGHDLHIANNANTKTGSYTNFGHSYRPPSGYSYGATNTKSLLAGNYNSFLISEIEVFYYHH